jgi:hypothetical protein
MLGKVVEFRLRYSERGWRWKGKVNQNVVHRLLERLTDFSSILIPLAVVFK